MADTGSHKSDSEVQTRPDKPTEKDVQQTPEHQKNVDRDGGERQPNQHTNEK